MVEPAHGSALSTGPTIDELELADAPERWEALGFTVRDSCAQVGSVRIRLTGDSSARGILGWSVRHLATTELDGLPTRISSSTIPHDAPAHPNGVAAIDHVVAISPALDRTVATLQAAGLELRRIREEPTPAGAPRQAFFRLGGDILEVIQIPQEEIEKAGGPGGPARLWGLAVIASDLDFAVAQMAPHAGPPHDAVQEGRRIATVARSAGLTVPLALMSA